MKNSPISPEMQGAPSCASCAKPMGFGYLATLPGCPVRTVVCVGCHAAGREADPDTVMAMTMAAIARDLAIDPDRFLAAWRAARGHWRAFARNLGVSRSRLDRAVSAATAPPPGSIRIADPLAGRRTGRRAQA
jgi:hypothetical protein